MEVNIELGGWYNRLSKINKYKSRPVSLRPQIFCLSRSNLLRINISFVKTFPLPEHRDTSESGRVSSCGHRRTSLPAVLQPHGMAKPIMIEARHFKELNLIINDLLQLQGLSQPAFLSLKRIKELLVSYHGRLYLTESKGELFVPSLISSQSLIMYEKMGNSSNKLVISQILTKYNFDEILF